MLANYHYFNSVLHTNNCSCLQLAKNFELHTNVSFICRIKPKVKIAEVLISSILKYIHLIHGIAICQLKIHIIILASSSYSRVFKKIPLPRLSWEKRVQYGNNFLYASQLYIEKNNKTFFDLSCLIWVSRKKSNSFFLTFEKKSLS